MWTSSNQCLKWKMLPFSFQRRSRTCFHRDPSMRWRNWSWWTPSTSRGTGRRNSQKKTPEMDSLSWTRWDFLFFLNILNSHEKEDLQHLSINLLMLGRLKLNQWRWWIRSQSFLWPSSRRWTVRFWSCRMSGRISVCWSFFLTRFKTKPLAFRRWDSSGFHYVELCNLINPTSRHLNEQSFA